MGGLKWARMLRGWYYLTNSPTLCVLGCLLLKSRACAFFLLFPQETLCWVFNVCLRISGRVGEKYNRNVGRDTNDSRFVISVFEQRSAFQATFGSGWPSVSGANSPHLPWSSCSLCFFNTNCSHHKERQQQAFQIPLLVSCNSCSPFCL